MSHDERHYNINKLNVIFAATSLLLFVSVGWLFLNDYARQWKDYQKNFRSLEIEKTRAKLDQASQNLEDQPGYQALLKEFEQAKKEYETKCSDFQELKNEIKEWQTKGNLVQQRHKFAKAELDAAKYRYESAKAHHTQNLESARAQFLGYDQKVRGLKLAVEESDRNLKEKQAVIDQCSEKLRGLERQRRQMASKRDILERKLKIIDPASMSLTNRLADQVRDWPIIDFANPNVKIRQIVLRDITDNVNFMHVPKVDRCTTCHMGITDTEYEGAPQPYRVHPNLDLYVGENSPHPLEEFGCTVCHGGRGRGTEFSSTAHTPSSPEQREQWGKKYGWKETELWEAPMLPLQYAQAGCFKCHDKEVTIKGADKLNLGIHLVEKAGCFNCHLIRQYEDWPKSGPALRKVKSKITKDWAYKWIEDPRSFRHNTWMPSFFGQSNNSDPESKKRAEQEIHAMVHYLFDTSEEFEMQDIPVQGDAEKGEERLASVGCLACHQIQPKESGQPITRDLLRRQHGPNLIGLGSKTTKKWLYHWLKEPAGYHPSTRMPDLRLTDQEAADIAEYLANNKNGPFGQKTVPPLNERVLDAIIMGFLTKMEPHTAAERKLASMDLDQKLNLAGERLIHHYGCYACHDIKGFERANPVGTELTKEGSKSAHKLDFGLIRLEQHANFSWFDQKLREPRIFDRDKVKVPDEKLRMPNFYFSDEEVDALVTAVMGFVDDKSVESKKMPRTARNLNIEAGQKVTHLFNCQGCHIIEGDGGAVQSTIQNWLVRYNDRSETEAAALVTGFSPPNLIGEGKKVYTEWLFNFLHQPSEIRPWLKVRMPAYNFKAAQLNSLVKYFNDLDDEEFPFTERIDTRLTEEEYQAGEKLFSKDYFDCAQCHIVGDKLPAGSPDRWAPDFALSKDRLKPQWIIEWLLNPADLLPGTKMPTYFDPNYFDDSGPPDILGGNENEQIRVLRNYLLTLTGASPSEETRQPEETPVPVETRPVSDDAG